MAGASLLPEYYNSKLKAAYLLAPPAAMSLGPSPSTVFAGHNWKAIVKAIDFFHLWNPLPYNFVNSDSAVITCGLFNGKICNWILSTSTDSDP